jgi:hypothetical protein
MHFFLHRHNVDITLHTTSSKDLPPPRTHNLVSARQIVYAASALP